IPHLAFSAGRHYCLGAPLARLHGEIAIGTLLARLPYLRLDGRPEWRGSLPLRELEYLPIAWNWTETAEPVLDELVGVAAALARRPAIGLRGTHPRLTGRRR